jgi:hypothetical protein
MIPLERERVRQNAGQALCLIGLAFMLAAIAACTRSPEYSALSAGAEPLRSRFNQDAGHVRIVILPAPT